MRLNPSQQRAVEFVTGTCLVLAGAGSGKTLVITNKIAHLIRERGYQARGLMISTFHTLGLEIIRREYTALGMKSNFWLFDDTDQLALLKDLTQP